jgi:hypothetical protein
VIEAKPFHDLVARFGGPIEATLSAREAAVDAMKDAPTSAKRTRWPPGGRSTARPRTSRAWPPSRRDMRVYNLEWDAAGEKSAHAQRRRSSSRCIDGCSSASRPRGARPDALGLRMPGRRVARQDWRRTRRRACAPPSRTRSARARAGPARCARRRPRPRACGAPPAPCARSPAGRSRGEGRRRRRPRRPRVEVRALARSARRADPRRGRAADRRARQGIRSPAAGLRRRAVRAGRRAHGRRRGPLAALVDGEPGLGARAGARPRRARSPSARSTTARGDGGREEGQGHDGGVLRDRDEEQAHRLRDRHLAEHGAAAQEKPPSSRAGAAGPVGVAEGATRSSRSRSGSSTAPSRRCPPTRGST